MARAAAKGTGRVFPVSRKAAAADDDSADMSFDIEERLESMSVIDLIELIDRATAIKDSKMSEERRAFIQEMRQKAAVLGVEVSLGEEPRGRRGPKPGSVRRPAAVKYRGPQPGQTWTGRGRMPRWLTALEGQGRARDEFLVDKAA